MLIRRIDELGRIVIPKDIRNELRIDSNDTLKIDLKNNEIIITKNEMDENLLKTINKVINNLYKIVKNNIIITNKDIVLDYRLEINYKLKKEKINEDISRKIIKRVKIKEKGNLCITNNLNIECNYIIEPIIKNSDVIGSIIYFKEKNITEEEIKLIELSKLFIETN